MKEKAKKNSYAKSASPSSSRLDSPVSMLQISDILYRAVLGTILWIIQRVFFYSKDCSKAANSSVLINSRTIHSGSFNNWRLRSDCFMVAVYRKTNCALFSADIPQHCGFIGCECANERVKMSGVCASRCQGLLTSYVIVTQHLTLSD